MTRPFRQISSAVVLDEAAVTIVRRPSREQAEEAVRVLIAYIGDDPQREGLLDTPRRMVSAYEELFAGYRARPAEFLDRTFQDSGGYDDLVLVRDIPFSSHCEHHIMPIAGHAHVCYLPADRLLGLSKIPRLVDALARRLQTQERLNAEIATALDTALKPRGVAVMLEAEHTCMATRGIRKPGSRTITTQFTGVFRDDMQERTRFLDLIGRGARP